MTQKFIIKINGAYLIESGGTSGNIVNAKKFDTSDLALAAITSDGNIYEIIPIYI